MCLGADQFAVGPGFDLGAAAINRSPIIDSSGRFEKIEKRIGVAGIDGGNRGGDDSGRRHGKTLPETGLDLGSESVRCAKPASSVTKVHLARSLASGRRTRNINVPPD